MPIKVVHRRLNLQQLPRVLMKKFAADVLAGDQAQQNRNDLGSPDGIDAANRVACEAQPLPTLS
jgi:hypothetical protein